MFAELRIAPSQTVVRRSVIRLLLPPPLSLPPSMGAGPVPQGPPQDAPPGPQSCCCLLRRASGSRRRGQCSRRAYEAGRRRASHNQRCRRLIDSERSLSTQSAARIDLLVRRSGSALGQGPAALWLAPERTAQPTCTAGRVGLGRPRDHAANLGPRQGPLAVCARGSPCRPMKRVECQRWFEDSEYLNNPPKGRTPGPAHVGRCGRRRTWTMGPGGPNRGRSGLASVVGGGAGGLLHLRCNASERCRRR